MNDKKDRMVRVEFNCKVFVNRTQKNVSGMCGMKVIIDSVLFSSKESDKCLSQHNCDLKRMWGETLLKEWNTIDTARS